MAVGDNRNGPYFAASPSRGSYRAFVSPVTHDLRSYRGRMLACAWRCASVSHGSTQKRYKEDSIIKALEGLHSDFYPVPCKIMYDLDNQPWHVVEPTVLTPVLDKQSLRSLYYEAGDILHRGRIEFVASAKIRKVKLETIQAMPPSSLTRTDTGSRRITVQARPEVSQDGNAPPPIELRTRSLRSFL
jgi:hypothetical protein